MNWIELYWQYDWGNFIGVNVFTRFYCLLPIWPWARMTVQKDHTKFNIPEIWMWRKSISWECIMLTRQMDLELVWKFKNVTQSWMSNSWDSSVEKISVKVISSPCNSRGVIYHVQKGKFDLGLDRKFKKVTQRSSSNLSKILVWRTSL